MSRSQFIVRVWIWKICVRDSRSGSPNSTFLSRRPGLRSAGSRVSGLLVAISTCTSTSCISLHLMLPRSCSNLQIKP